MREKYHPPAEEITLAGMLYALSDPTRLAIVAELAGGKELPCVSFEHYAPKSTKSYHFRVLREAGVTRSRADGAQRLISLRAVELNKRFPGLLKAILAAAANET